MAKPVITAEAPPAEVPKLSASSGSNGSTARSAEALANEASARTTTARPLIESESEFLQRMRAQLRLLHLAARGHADGLEIFDDAQVLGHPEIRASSSRPVFQI